VALTYDDQGVRHVALPDPACASGRVDNEDGGLDDAPEWLRSAAHRIRAHLGGEPQRFDDVPVAIDRKAPFTRAVLEHVRGIAVGSFETYGEIARKLGRPGGARAVGQAMATNPVPLVVPCHRVLGADRRLTGFTSPGGTPAKARLLQIEGVLL
jgi:methylated-DNA-[protein]-cysteine S-methyltransferase